jgi:hypothetical protein
MAWLPGVKGRRVNSAPMSAAEVMQQRLIRTKKEFVRPFAAPHTPPLTMKFAPRVKLLNGDHEIIRVVRAAEAQALFAARKVVRCTRGKCVHELMLVGHLPR